MPKIVTFLSILLISLLIPLEIYSASLSITLSPASPTAQDNLLISYDGIDVGTCLVIYFKKDAADLIFTGSRADSQCYTDSRSYDSLLARNPEGSYGIDPQTTGNYEVFARVYKESCNIDVLGNRAFCSWKLQKTSHTIKFTVQPAQSDYQSTLSINPSSGKAGENFTANTTLKKNDGSPIEKAFIQLKITNLEGRPIGQGSTDNSGTSSINISNRVADLAAGSYNIQAQILTPDNKNIFTTANLVITTDKKGHTFSSSIPPPCTPGTPGCTSSSGIACDSGEGVATAIGCVHTKPLALITDLFRFSLGIGGGVAFLLMLIGVLEMITSAGSPERLKAGHDRFASAIIGILFVVFSVLFMQIIGVDILGILPEV
ncbi:MAG: hypothetical protein HYW45_01960 [Candidatus Daviesbacteria bacterium]|nr:MAG: hypothetical protein HYW45_01960 [Candidatus Daviesbacteria bacterium]